MHITNDSSYPTINAWSRTLAYDSLQTRELLLNYLRWLDQSYGATVSCELRADRSSAISIHGVHQLTLSVHQGRIRVEWLQPEASYLPTLQRGMSPPAEVAETHGGARWQFSIANKHDGYLLRDLTGHIHR
jgi:hypothetical protein